MLQKTPKINFSLISMTIRKISRDDNGRLAAIIRHSLFEYRAAKIGTVYFDETTDHLSDLFANTRSAYFVAEVEGEVAGGAGIYPTNGLPENTCELVKMYLAKDFRGKGYGQQLLQKCAEAAIEKGYTRMYIETMDELSDAIAFYEKNDFKPLEQPMGNSGHTGCTRWMIKELS